MEDTLTPEIVTDNKAITKLDRIEDAGTAKYKSGITKTRQGLLTCAEAIYTTREKLLAASKLEGGLRYNEWLGKLKISQSTAERWITVHEQREFIKALPVITDSATVYYEFARLWSEKDQAKALKALGDTPKAITKAEANNLVNAITNPNPKAKPTDNQLPVMTEMLGGPSAPAPEHDDDLGTGPVLEPQSNQVVIVEDETDWLLPAQQKTMLLAALRQLLKSHGVKGVKVTVERG